MTFYNFPMAVIAFDDFSAIRGTEHGNHMAVAFEPGQDHLQMHRQIGLLDPGLQVSLLINDVEAIENLSFLEIFIYIFAGIIALACTFMVASSFHSFVEKYRNQFAIMRSMGAHTRQLGQIIFVQGAIVVGGGALVGFLLGFILHRGLFRVFAWLFSVSVQVSFHIGEGLLVAFLFATTVLFFHLVLCRKYSRVLPLQVVPKGKLGDGSKGRFASGLFFFILSALLATVSIFDQGDGNHRLFGLLAILFYVLGLRGAFGWIVGGVLKGSRALLDSVSKGVPGIAIANMVNQLAVTRRVVFSVSLVFLLAVFGGTLLETINRNAHIHMEQDYFLDINVTDITGHQSQLGDLFLQDLRAAVGDENIIITSDPMAYLLAPNLNTRHYDVAYISIPTLAAHSAVELVSNNIEDMAIITAEFANARGLSVGDVLTLWYNPNLWGWTPGTEPLPITESFTFRIGGIIANPPFRFQPVPIFIDWDNQVLPPDDFLFYKAYIATNDIAYTTAQLMALQGQYPEIRFSTLEESRARHDTMFRERYGMFIFVMLLVVFALAMGVVNTIKDSIYQRRKEYAVLRAIGTPPKMIGQVICLQVFLCLLMGAAFGVVSGMYLSAVMALGIEQTRIFFDYLPTVIAFVAIVAALVVAVAPKVSQLLKGDILTEIRA